MTLDPDPKLIAVKLLLEKWSFTWTKGNTSLK